MRATGSDKAEIVSQLLFGDHYTVTGLSDNGKWCRVKMFFDGYEGWIDAKQHHPISDEYFNQINNSDYKICTDLTATILFNKLQTNIVIGSILPISTNEMFKMEEQLAFNGEAKSLSAKRDYDFLKSIALKYLNAPYLWGGRSPFGIDCSGLTQVVYRISGYQLPRDSGQQVKKGEEVAFADSQPGDLAFFGNEDGKITHVGIVMEDGQIIHASGKVRIDELRQEGIRHADTTALTHRLTTIRRVIKF